MRRVSERESEWRRGNRDGDEGCGRMVCSVCWLVGLGWGEGDSIYLYPGREVERRAVVGEGREGGKNE